ncbi:response regulator transcription factor [Paenibacillus alkalitolerans]|uniref:response regulator transcription factor n=1 Tax=Paenibacillus alkalitolerans TaxID=2799335 RepID=UPI0018F3C334|nr:response regulator [Paenibacillus alkalitolerans]
MLKLMIVDDEPVILSGIRDMVEQENTAFTKIVTACDAIEALEKIDYFHPDLIITDIQMPEMDGLEFIGRAKDKGAKRFIILTGYDVFEYARQALRLQVADYLLKPINERQLHELLKRMAIDVMAERSQTGESGGASREEQAEWLSEHVKMLKDYIAANYMKDISLTEAAAYLGLHPSYIGQLFKKETGESFVRCVNQIRIDKAKELLTSREKISLEKIAGCVGFENRRTFYKVFRKYTGQTPGQYRDSLPNHCIDKSENY